MARIMAVGLALALCAAGAAFALLLVVRDEQPVPTAFELDYHATGWIENVANGPAGCVATIAIYGWQSLSRGYPITDVPVRNDRFRLRGTPDDCNALQIAQNVTDGHVFFAAGRADGRWYFSGRPQLGLGCGGLTNDWMPGPVVRTF